MSTPPSASGRTVAVHVRGEGRIAGFGGLATNPTQHSFVIDRGQLWTWCAWDSLFIPQILGAPARVTSKDPETGGNIQLVVSPQGVESVSPATAAVSFVLPAEDSFDESARELMRTFCHFVFFFESPASGRNWAATHPGTLLLSVDEAFELGQRLNDHTFGDALGNG